MRYSRLEKYGNTAFANDALYNSQSHVKTKADPSKSNPFRTKKKELKAGPNGIVYYNVAKNVVAILVPETHPLFNLCLGIGYKVKLPPSDIFNNLQKMTAVYVDSLLEKLNTNR